ncbi:MAG: hypothetical protein WB777_14230 [Mycobacterium sp.]
MTAVMPEGGSVVNGKYYASAQAAQAALTGGSVASGTGLSAQAIIENALAPYGLESLGSWAWQAYNQSGGSLDYVNSQLPQQQAFKDRFPEYDILAARGQAMTPAQIISIEQQTAQQLQAAGLTGMAGYDPRTVTAANLTNNVSTNEFQARLDARQLAASQYHPDVANQLSTLYGINGNQALTAFATDPDNALPMIQQQVLAAQDAASASNSGFGQLTQAQAAHLAQLGVSQDQATQGFGQIAGLGQLRTALPGEADGGVSADTQIAAQFQGGTAAVQLANEQARRQAAFSNRSQYASSQSGISGVGVATQNQG